MNKFRNKYDNIKVSDLPADLRSKVIIKEKQKSSRTTDITPSDPYNLPK